MACHVPTTSRQHGHLKLMFDLIFLHCGATPACKARVDKRFNNYFTLQLMAEGAVELFYEDARHELRGENCWFWPAFPGPRIRFHAARDVAHWNHRYAAFTGPLVEHWQRAGWWLEVPQKAPRGAQNVAVFDEMLFHINRGSAWGERRAINLLESLLLELAEARSATGSQEVWLETAREFLAQTEPFSPDYAQLARELGWGLSTLRRKFKAATGLSLHEALLQNRLDNARRLLGETDLPLKAIAAQLGYRDAQFFAAEFKQLSGVTPAVYRRSRQ